MNSPPQSVSFLPHCGPQACPAFDHVSAWPGGGRFRGHFRGTAGTNPTTVSMETPGPGGSNSFLWESGIPNKRSEPCRQPGGRRRRTASPQREKAGLTTRPPAQGAYPRIFQSLGPADPDSVKHPSPFAANNPHFR